MKFTRQGVRDLNDIGPKNLPRNKKAADFEYQFDFERSLDDPGGPLDWKGERGYPYNGRKRSTK